MPRINGKIASPLPLLDSVISLARQRKTTIRALQDKPRGIVEGQPWELTRNSNGVVITIIPGASWIGGTSADWNVASNWCGGVLPTAATDVVIPAGILFNPVISNATIALCRNLTISSGATLTVNNTRQISVSGNLTD